LINLLKIIIELIENLVFDLGRILVGSLILLFVILTYFLNLDLLLYSVIITLIFIELKISNILNLKYLLFFISLYFLIIFFYFYSDLFIIYFPFIFLCLILLSFFSIFLKYIFVILIILFSIFFFYLLNLNREIIYLIIFISFFNDTAAYLFGKLLKGPLILPSISPKKTWSGTLFSFLLSFLILIYLSYSFLLSFTLSLSLFLGDLYFSYIKRKLHLKDFSSLLSSHGGIMDRLDSMFLITFILFLSESI
tara:strand:+ start:329 stop:1081 length:753 start_codon:yes stop_codon:yes gene_type:complete